MLDYSFYGLAILQGCFYLATGIWPLVGIRSFQQVTGPKTDLWLVRTVGVLVAVIGTTLLLAGIRDAWSLEILVLGMAVAFGLALIDVFYVLRKVIAPIYLLDALVELGFVAAWLTVAYIHRA